MVFMKYKINEHKDELITDLLKKLIWVPIAAIVPIVSSLIKVLYNNIKANASSIFTPTNILIAVSIIFSIISICISLRKQKKRHRKDKDSVLNMPSEIEADFRFNSITATLTFDDRININSEIAYDMVVISDNVSEIKKDVIWTGTEYNGTTLVEPSEGYELVESRKTNSPYEYTIFFDSEKKRGDCIRLKTRTCVKDTNKEMKSIYSFMAKYQIDTLKIVVVAPKGLLRNVKGSVYADRSQNILVEAPKTVFTETIGNLKRYTYEINNPTFLYNYFIEWDFTK